MGTNKDTYKDYEDIYNSMQEEVDKIEEGEYKHYLELHAKFDKRRLYDIHKNQILKDKYDAVQRIKEAMQAGISVEILLKAQKGDKNALHEISVAIIEKRDKDDWMVGRN